jgi:hypothetical protein
MFHAHLQSYTNSGEDITAGVKNSFLTPHRFVPCPVTKRIGTISGEEIVSNVLL